MKRLLAPSLLLLGFFAALGTAASPALLPRVLGPLLLARYKGGEVTGGGTISGTVKIDTIPEVAKFEIAKDPEICGAQKPSDRLKVDAATKGVKNTVVYLEGIEKGKPRPADQSFLIDQKGCEYVPHVLVAPVRSSVSFKSSDPILHNVHVYKGTPEQPHARSADVLNVPFQDETAAPAGLDKRTMRRPGFYSVQCDAGHAWMSCYVWVVEHPYYAVTDDQGKFELKDIPPGTYTLKFWHEGFTAKPILQGGKVSGYEYSPPVLHTATVTVAAGKTVVSSWTMSGK